MKYIILYFLFFFQFLAAQYRVEGTFVDSFPRVKKVALYQYKRGIPEYLTYVSVEKRKFTFPMDSLSKGSYRVLYKNSPSGYIDFIYNKEDVVFTVNSEMGQISINYLQSRENQLLVAYQYYIPQLQRYLDNIQMSFFSESEGDVNQYKNVQSKIESAQSYYENLAKNDHCLSFIKASKQYNALFPFKSITDYRESVIEHFFDYIDFGDKSLKNSQFLKNKVSEYVFTLHQSENKEIEDKLLTSAISKIDALFMANSVKELVLQRILLQSIANENSKIVQYTLSIYKRLPQEYQNLEFLKKVEQESKTILGVIAPNIRLSKKETLYDLSGFEKYLVVFWSTACPHCSSELPNIAAFLNDKSTTSVVSIALEDENRVEWDREVEKYSSWKNVYSEGKWENINAINYNVHSTPSYFLLNKEKLIIAKPSSLEELKRLLD